MASGWPSRPVSAVQSGLNGLAAQYVWLPWIADATNPSIAPPSMSLAASISPCGPPSLIREVSWNGFTQAWTRGSGTQTSGRPCRIGMPSAPG